MSAEAEGTCDFYFAKTRQARTAHRCSACGLSIHPRQRYREIRMAYGGTAETIKRCGACETVYQHLQTLIYWYQYVDERLDCGLSYREEWETDPPVEIQAAIFATSDEASALLEVPR